MAGSRRAAASFSREDMWIVTLSTSIGSLPGDLPLPCRLVSFFHSFLRRRLPVILWRIFSVSLCLPITPTKNCFVAPVLEETLFSLCGLNLDVTGFSTKTCLMRFFWYFFTISETSVTTQRGQLCHLLRNSTPIENWLRYRQKSEKFKYTVRYLRGECSITVASQTRSPIGRRSNWQSKAEEIEQWIRYWAHFILFGYLFDCGKIRAVLVLLPKSNQNNASQRIDFAVNG